MNTTDIKWTSNVNLLLNQPRLENSLKEQNKKNKATTFCSSIGKGIIHCELKHKKISGINEWKNWSSWNHNENNFASD